MTSLNSGAMKAHWKRNKKVADGIKKEERKRRSDQRKVQTDVKIVRYIEAKARWEQDEKDDYGVSHGESKPVTDEQSKLLDDLDVTFTLDGFKLDDEKDHSDYEWLHQSWGDAEPNEQGVLKRFIGGKTTTSIARYYCTSRLEVLRVWGKHKGNDKLLNILSINN